MALPTQRDFEETLQAPPNTLRRQRVTVGTNLRGINLASWGATQYDVTIETKRRRERTQQPGRERAAGRGPRSRRRRPRPSSRRRRRAKSPKPSSATLRS